jgi:hypothetical protein
MRLRSSLDIERNQEDWHATRIAIVSARGVTMGAGNTLPRRGLTDRHLELSRQEMKNVDDIEFGIRGRLHEALQIYIGQVGGDAQIRNPSDYAASGHSAWYQRVSQRFQPSLLSLSIDFATPVAPAFARQPRGRLLEERPVAVEGARSTEPRKCFAED